MRGSGLAKLRLQIAPRHNKAHHAEQAWARMLGGEVLVVEARPVDGDAAGAVALQEVSALLRQCRMGWGLSVGWRKLHSTARMLAQWRPMVPPHEQARAAAC